MRQFTRLVLTLVLCLAFGILGGWVADPIALAADAYTWTAMSTGLTNMTVWGLAINPVTPSTLYVGTYNGGIFRSTDSGAHWTPVNTGLPLPYLPIGSFAINPDTPSTLYAATLSGGEGAVGGVFRSTDSGDHWTATALSGARTEVRFVAIDPDTPAVLYAGTGRGLFRSADGGTTWTAVNTGLTKHTATGTSIIPLNALAIDPAAPATLYAGTDEGVFRSTDSGNDWTAVNVGLTNPCVVTVLAIDPLAPTNLYAGTEDMVFCSTDSGNTWIAATACPTSTIHPTRTIYLSCLLVDPHTPSTLYAGTPLGVFRSMDSGSTWATVNIGLTSIDVWALAINPLDPTVLYAGTYGGGVFRYDVVPSYALTTTASPSDGGSIHRTPDAASYAFGTVVTLTAIPAAGHTFTGWSGNATGTTNPQAIHMDADNTITATFLPDTESLSVAKVGNGTVMLDPAGGTHDYGTVVTLTATPSSGYVFSGWSGDLTGTANPAVLNMDSSKSVTAVFAEHVTNSLAVSVNGKGSVGRSPDLPSYEPGTAVTVTATASPGYVFSGWSGDLTGTANPAVLNMDSSKSVTARFTPKLEESSIIPSAGPGGHISPGTVQYLQAGASMTFWVTPDTGYHLAEVVANGVVQGLSKGYTFTDVHGANTIHASFAPDFCKLTIAPLQHGTIARSPSLTSYSYGAVVTLTAAPASGYRLVGWIGAVASGTNPLKATVKMDTDKTISATFQAISGPPPAVTLSSPSNGSSIRGSTATLSWKASSGATSYRLDLAKSSAFANATAWTISGTSRTASALSPGTTYYWRVTAVNTRGTSPWSPVFHFTTKKPEVTLTLTLRLGSSQMLVTDGKGASDSWTLDAAPLLGIGSRTLVPIRAVAEAIGGTVEWNSSARAATVVVGGNTLVLTLGRNTASLNGEATRIDTDSRVVPTIINARTMLPLRFVAESLGAQVSYNSSTKTIVITCPVG
ncbi:hypothetical protein SMC3_08350 [Candidatus Cryosericum hinesii]|jgi:uncharacterized repeat protein (TIGR02543 family)|uniref:Fibronectin type-III domain-containing protein n=1 Tax=Candidatus Cryosericum hinesii TaxID=2290915 RepID=A0A398DDS5_9BACT|nr:stalk domain-containing protein [Candidatus Cryosericum hinesii]RIE11789.1 hypothetical protein SMC3_08350 [Candidatus Cryosericum hinesii]